MVSGPVLPDWLTYDEKDTEAHRRAVTDVARRRGHLATTAAPVQEPPGVQAGTPAPQGGKPGGGELLSFREWAEINAPGLIGRLFVPRAELEAAKNAFATYVAIERRRSDTRLEEGHLQARQTDAQTRQAKASQRTPQTALDEAAAAAAWQQHPQDPLAARRAYRAGSAAKPPTLTQDAEQAARTQHPDDPLGALGAVAAAKRPPSSATTQPLIPSRSIGESLAGVPGAESMGILSQVDEDPIGGWLKLRAFAETNQAAWNDTQRKQVERVIDEKRPSLAQINEAWESGYFGKGVQAQAQYVAVVNAALSPEEVSRLEHLGRSQRMGTLRRK